MKLPYFTHDLPGIGGAIKQRTEDFFVQEIPLYEPSGEGEHVYVEIQKLDLTTFDAINRLARALNVCSRDIGYAGLKDARAVTRQVLSIPGVTPERVMGLQLPDIQVQWASRHGNKLRPGHLAGNRFAIKIRDVNPTDIVKLRPLLDRLQHRGLPNYFGDQRFGRRGDNAALGALLVRGDDEGLLRQLLGQPDPAVDDADAQRGRAAFDRGDYPGAMDAYPRFYGLERQVLSRLIKKRNATAAAASIDQKIRRLWISALQSEVFNQVLARRIDGIDRLLPGDFAIKHDSGGCFLVEDVGAEQPRCDAFAISPTGPMIGYRMNSPVADAGALEQTVLDTHRLAAEHFRESGRLRIKGDRRPLRVRPTDMSVSAGVDERGGYITAAFTLPAGSYATVLIREITKID